MYTCKALLDQGGIDAQRATLGPAVRTTLERVGVLIERIYGVTFGQTQIWRILGNLRFSLQKARAPRDRA